MTVFTLEAGSSADHLVKGLKDAFPLDVTQEEAEEVTYLDTFDWRLHRAGFALASSPAGRQFRIRVMEGPALVVDAEASRSPSFARELPDGPLGELLEPLAKHRRFLPMARAQWEGKQISVLNEDRKTVVRIRIREGLALPEGKEEPRPLQTRVECHPLKGYRAEERDVLRLLREMGGLKRERRTELTTVYQTLGQEPGHYSSSFDLALDPAMPAEEAARAIHQVLLQTLHANREGVSKDWDAEFLHDFRVAVRRTRSALTQLKGVFPEEATDHFREEFRWLGSRTGPARDLDVYLLKIPTYKASLYAEAQEALGPLEALLSQKKKIELRRLRGCLRSKRFLRLLDEWRGFLDDPPADEGRTPNARRPIAQVAAERIWTVYDKVLRKGEKIGPDSPPGQLHKLRIDCKKLRYLLTFFRSLYSADALDPFIKELKKLQNLLGDYNDLHVQREAIQTFAEEMMATETGPPATLLAMGQLMGQLEERQVFERDGFHQAFARFSRKKNRTRFRELFGPKPEAFPTSPEPEEAP